MNKKNVLEVIRRFFEESGIRRHRRRNGEKLVIPFPSELIFFSLFRVTIDELFVNNARAAVGKLNLLVMGKSSSICLMHYK